MQLRELVASGKMKREVSRVSIKEELERIAGAGNVLDDEKTLEEYSRDESFVHPIKPRCVVKVKGSEDPDKTHEEVQAIVRWANETSTPLVPLSSGPPHFRGDTVPGVGGAVVVDMSGMNRIIRVNYREQMAMIEPGVTFTELIPELEKEGMRPHMPLIPRGSKSVLGSYLEKEPIIMPRHHWCSIDPILCVRTILGSGDMLQTGTGAGLWPLEVEWTQKKAQKFWSSEQYDIVKMSQSSQGTISIITWASVKCALLPQIHKLYLVPCDRLEPLIDFAYMLLRYRWGEEILFLNNQNLASILAEGKEDIETLREVLPPYVLILGIVGLPEFFPEDRVAYQEADIKELAQRYGVVPGEAMPGVSGEEVKRALYTPTDGIPWKLRSKGGCQDVFFVTTLDRTPEFIKVMYTQAEAYGYPATDMGIYLQPIVQGTSCHCEFNLTYDPADPRETDKVKRLITEGARVLVDKGGYFYRPYGPWKEIAYSRVSGEEFAALKKMKRIFDPKGILNPGKACF